MFYYSVTLYEVEKNKQVLKEGSWDSIDCVWEWESESVYFEKYEDAKKKFNRTRVTDNQPIIRLYRTTYNQYGQVDERELLDEKD